MKNNQFSVHESVVVSSRKALTLYFFKQNRAYDVPSIRSQLFDLN